jgi:hypothetical protein
VPGLRVERLGDLVDDTKRRTRIFPVCTENLVRLTR